MLIPRSPQTRLSIDSFNLIRAKLDAILSQKSTQKARIKGNARLLPPLSKTFLDQLELNQSIILRKGVRIYKLAINTLKSFKVQKQLKNNCKERLTDLIESVKDLDWLYPSGHWELLDSECLKVGPKERDYKEAYKRLNLELQETMLNSLGLLKIVDNLLLRLDSPNQEKWKVKEEGIEELKTEDGRAVLNTARHNGMVRGQLNKLSMNLSGLADQVSNELSLLTWIKDEPAKLFGSTSKEIRLDLEQLRFQLDGLEVKFNGFVHLIGLRAFLTDQQ
ncbi:hypothetical protein PPACK8108_LOCUS13507 [Phakopsora pachyrhizi]|uniref:Uncharacterized protein n=1 Tax=Phakopsora pachyrhizi TaxID=170000 RepID=A0AAV0B5S6_PHAPC|nr:hypothetical protein PPACK8108_LOCUS13507 [Phakopsora pachyrhizi]